MQINTIIRTFFAAAAFVIFPSILVKNNMAEAAQAVYLVPDANVSESKLIYEYHPYSQYTLNTKVGNVSDIELHPCEEITNITAGDTQRWLVAKAIVGGTAHVYIKPLSNDISTNMIINTDCRSYRIVVTSGQEYNAVVGWIFKEETARNKKLKENEIRKLRDVDFFDINKRNYSYEIRNNKKLDKELLPLSVWDNGKQTFIKMPASNKYDLPVLYNINADKKQDLVNYRVKSNTYIADRIFKKARLQYTQKKYVEIVFSSTKKSFRNPKRSTSVSQSIKVVNTEKFSKKMGQEKLQVIYGCPWDREAK